MNRIWIGADWHFYSISNDTRHPFYSHYKLGKFADNFAQNIREDDLLIFLGDLCDPAVTKLDDVAKIIREIPCYKIMCRGNHDIQDDDFYKEVGFDEVTEVLRIHNMLFSHKPLKVAPDEINIHGHLHTEKLVTSGHQHINAYAANWSEDGGLILLEDLLDAAANQQIEIKPREAAHIQEKFDKYTTIESDIYTKILDVSDEFMLCPIDEASNMLKLPDFKTPLELSKWMRTNIKYSNFTKMKTSDQVLRDRRGSCHDQVVLEYPLLKGLGVHPKILFFVAYRDGEPGGGMTHTLVYWEERGMVKWFENAMGGMEGIHTFNSMEDMKDRIREIYSSMPDSKKHPDLLFINTTIGHFQPGCTLGEFVDSIINDKLDETQDEPLDEILFPDVESTKYWLNDDKSFRKKADKGDAEAADTAGVAIDEASFADVKRIVDSIPKDEHHLFYHSDEFKDSPYVIYRDVKWLPNVRGKVGAFIDVYALDDPGTGIIVIAASPQARGKGLTGQLIKGAQDAMTGLGITTLYWRCDKDNMASYKLAERNGFILDKRETSKDQYVLKYVKHGAKINEASSSHKLRADVTESNNPNDPESNKAVDIIFYDGQNKIGEASISAVDTDNAFLYNVEVYKKYRGQGYSHDIMKYIMSHYKVNELTVDKDNEVAISLYKKHGFKLFCEYKENGKWLYDMRIDCSDPIPKGCRPIQESSADIPKTCPKCGSKIGVFLKGEPVYLCTNKDCGKYFGVVPFKNEAVADTHSLDREQKKDVAEKYGLRNVGASSEAEEEDRKANEERENRKKEEERIKALEKKRNDRLKNLKKARKAKKRKAFKRKVASKLPGIIHESVDTGDAKYLDYPEVDHTELWVDRIQFFEPKERYENPKAVDETKSIQESYVFEMVEHIQFFDRVNESAEDNKLYPVYIMLMHSGTALANAIKKVTQSQFSHCSISFDSSMHQMYSFGRKFDVNPFIGGFKKEDIRSKFFQDKQIPYALYVVPCTQDQIAAMKKRLDYFVKNATKFRYDFTGLLKNYFGIADNPEYKWFCSRFVADILNAGRPSPEPYIVEPSLMKPEDFRYTTFAQYVTGGYLSNYHQKFVENVTKRILRTEMMKQQKITKIEDQFNETAYGVDRDNPWAIDVLNYQLTVMDESVVDNFLQYLQSFKIRFSKDGDILVTRREYDQLETHFRNSLKMIKAHENAGNVDGVKDELCKIYYMIDLINKYYLREDVKNMKPNSKDVRKDMLDLRSVMLNVFQQHLKWVTMREPKWNFNTYYDNSKYGKNMTIPQKVITSIGKAIVTVLK